MPFLATMTFTLVVCTVANMLSTVQADSTHVLRLDAKMVILISCAGGIVTSAILVALTPMVHRRKEAALQSDMKASGKVRQLCWGCSGGCCLQAACNSRHIAIALLLLEYMQQASVHKQVGNR